MVDPEVVTRWAARREADRELRQAMIARGEAPLKRTAVRALLLSGVTDLSGHLGRPLRFIERCAVRGLAPEIARHVVDEAAKAERRRLLAERAEARRSLWARYREEQKDAIRAAGGVRAAAANAKRKARMALAFKESVNPDVVFDRSGGVCGICGEAVTRDKMTMDHIVPLALGGEHSYANVQAAHKKCNSGKGARWIGGIQGRTASAVPV